MAAATPGRRGALERWTKDAKLSDGGEVGGTATDEVTARLDVVPAVNDLLALARKSGASVPPKIEGDDAKQLERAARSARLRLWTGKDDRLLRRLLIDGELGVEAPQSLRRVFADRVGVRVEFELAVSNPNREMRVAEPKNPRPYSELGTS